jgi:soluble lytic murein transglycosylase-like protein
MAIISGLFIIGSLITADAKFYQHEISSADLKCADLKCADLKYSSKEVALIDYVKKINPDLKIKEAEDIVFSAAKWSEKFGQPLELLLAVAKIESKFNKHAISSSGALGLWQVIPSWHIDKMKVALRETGSPELFNINTNAFVGTWVLADCAKQFKNTKSSLLCYNGSNKAPNGYDDKVLAAKKDIERFIERET